MLRLLSLAPPLLLASSCKEKFPSIPTIVTGRVVDENDIPVERVRLQLDGIKRTGVSATTTFSITADTDEDGIYTLSQIVPKETDKVAILMDAGFLEEPNGSYGYIPYIQIDGVYESVAVPHRIPASNYGKTTTINYQLRKQ